MNMGGFPGLKIETRGTQAYRRDEQTTRSGLLDPRDQGCWILISTRSFGVSVNGEINRVTANVRAIQCRSINGAIRNWAPHPFAQFSARMGDLERRSRSKAATSACVAPGPAPVARPTRAPGGDRRETCAPSNPSSGHRRRQCEPAQPACLLWRRPGRPRR